MVLTLLGTCALTLSLQAAPGATVRGVVRDAASGDPLPGAVVVLTDLERAATTDADGGYVLESVPPGPQHLEVRRLGYASRMVHLMVPRAGTLEFDVSLGPAPFVVEGVVALGDRPMRGLEPGDSTAFPDRGLSMAALRNLPTLAQPDAFRALAGGEVVLDPEAAMGVHVRGGGADHTAYLVDGVPVLNPYHAAGLFSALNTDALAGIRLAAAPGSPALHDALSGTITATTRDPGERPRARGALSNAEARLTMDGPAGGDGAGYLVGVRSGFPAALAPREASYLAGEAGDLLAKIQAPVLGGTGRVVVYGSEDEIEAASEVVDGPDTGGPIDRNRFEWGSRSVGLGWVSGGVSDADVDRTTATVTAWHSSSDAGSRWRVPDGTLTLASRRADLGVQGVIERRSGGGTGELGLRVHRIETDYRVAATGAGTALDLSGSTAAATLFGGWSARLGPAVSAHATAAASLSDGAVRFSPRARISGRPGASTAWTVAWARTHQYAQSLRNPESLVGHVFPADLFVATGVAGVPVPRSDQLVVAGTWAPLAGVRVGVQGFRRRLTGLVLVASAEPDPFATRSPPVGSATARGVSVDVAARGARYGVVVGYGWQRIRIRVADAAYVPRHGVAHSVDGGVIVFPSATSSARIGVVAVAGRRATGVDGPFEWEACNLLDHGCEFAGSPRLSGAPGAAGLPAYVRMDVGARKHWHLRAGGRDILIGVFGTVTNVLGRRNTLAWVSDPATGTREPIEMLPRAPLVLGLDGRF